MIADFNHVMEEFFKELFGSNYMPHGHCYYWEPSIVWSHAISDSIIAIAYMTIPMSLLFIFRKRKDFKFIWMMILFAIFILGCGMTHVFDVLNIWWPFYRTDAVVRMVTAAASIGTAAVLIKVTPEVILIPSAAEWKRVNEELKAQVVELQEKDKTIEAFKHFEYLAETLPQLVWISNPKGEATFFNQRWYQYTGVHFSENLKGALNEVVYPAHKEKVLKLWDRSRHTGDQFEMELCIKNSEGQYRWHLGRALPVKSNELIILWVCTLTDIHDQKKHHELLAKKNEQLMRINNDLDNFIYTASHDLKAPITNLEGLLNAFEEGETDVDIKPLMRKSIENLNNTIQELSDIAKIQRESNEEVKLIDLAETIEDVKQDFSGQIEKYDATIITDLHEKKIRISRKNLKSILSNLLSNSLKYSSPERKPEIKIISVQENDYYVLKVQDNGLGFDPSKKDKAFSLFRRLHNHVEGTGIGLYIVKRIVQNIGGKIDVESKAGAGTIFTIWIPVKGES